MNGNARTTLVEMLDQVTQRQADKLAFVYLPDGEREADSVTFGQLDRKARALAAHLVERGLTGQRAILSGHPGTDFVVALAGCFLAGVTAVPLVPENNNHHRRQRLRHIITDCSPAVELTSTDPGAAPASHSAERDNDLPRLLVDTIDPADADGFSPAAVTPDTLAILQYTSGSTAAPRGVMVSHRNVLANVAMLERLFAQPPDRCTVNWLPLHHDMGLFGNVLRSLYSGSTCVLMPPSAFLRRPLRWLQAIERYSAHVSGAPNFAYDMCVRRTTDEDRAALDLSCWKVAFNGSEPVRAQTLERFSEAFAPAGFAPTTFLPGYGLAEATLVVSGVAAPDQPTVYDVSGEALRAGEIMTTKTAGGDTIRLVSCGPPLPGAEVTLVDPATRRPVPAGQVGEIWVRGDSVAVGYWNRPKKTAEVFGARLAAGPADGPVDTTEAPYLRTGDLGSMVDGELVVTGRIKDLIIIRGANYYPQDIEYTVRDSLDPAKAGYTAVFAEQHTDGERLIVVQELSPSRLDVVEVCDEIHKRVMVNHGVPVHRIVLVPKGQVPRTSSGKVQRSRCRQLLADGQLKIIHEDVQHADQPPTPSTRPAMDESFLDDLRAMISALVERPVSAISPDEPLTAARVDSLHAAELQEQLYQRFGVEIELTTLLGEQPLREVAEALYAATFDRADRPPAGPQPATEPTGSPLDPFPLTDLQEAYLAGRSPGFELGGVATHVYLEYQHDDLDVPRAVEAWQQTVRRHDMLRAVITPQGRQRILPELAEPIHVDDHRDRSDADEQVLRTRERMSHQVLDPYTGPLFEVRLSLLPGSQTVIHLSFDLLILDASGVLAVLREWGRHYAATGDAGPVAGPSFRDFILRHRDRDTGPPTDALQARAAQLPPGPALPLAVDPASIGTPVFRRRSVRLTPQVWRRLEAAAGRRGVTRAALLGAAFSEVLARYSEQRPFTLTVTSFARPTGQIGPEVVGEFTRLLLVPVADRCPDFDARLRDFSQQLLTAWQQRDVDGVALLRERMRAEPGRPPRPLAPVVFTCLMDDADLGWLGAQRYAISQTPQVWLDHQVVFDAGVPELIWDAVEELFPTGLLDLMFDTYQRLLHNLAGHESWRIDGGALAGLQRLADRTASAALRGSDQTLDRLVETQIERTPQAEAVVSDGWRITYRQLGNASALVANRLVELGAQPGDLVLVTLPKGWAQVAAVLGTLRAGGVYVPVDPDVTAARMRQLLTDSTARFIVTTAALAATRDWAAAAVCLPVDQLWPDGLDQPVAAPQVRRQPQDLAYLIYTSGSTGNPKGVAIEHRGAANTVLDINDRFGVGPADAVLGITPLTFDLSVYDIFGPLSAGARLVLPDHERRGEPSHWVELTRREGVTLWNSVPSLLRLLVEDPAAADRRWARRLRLLMLSGDWIGLDLAARLRRDLPQARLISLGGATEGSIWSVAYEVDQVDPAWRSVPYGTALRGQDAVVLDDQLEPLPPLVTGPLYLSGVGLAREYWRDPDKTAASFVVHPGTGRRLYRTGDLARLLPDGNLELLGREDNQLKVQGHRIEPGEVEAALVSHPAVLGAVVGAVGARDGVRRLVAYVRLHPSPAVTRAQLREHVAGLLPRYLVPDSIRVVDDFPLTVNGKLDRRALFDHAGHDDAGPGGAATPEAAPAQAVAQVCAPDVRASVLRAVGLVAGMPEVSEDTPFTALEFTSVHLIRLANALEAQCGARPPLIDLYQMTTVDDLVRYYGQASPRAVAAPAAGLAGNTPGSVDGTAGTVAVLTDAGERAAFVRRHRSRPAPPGTGIVINLPGVDDPIDQDLLERRTAPGFAAEPLPAADLAEWLGYLRERMVDGRGRHGWGSAGGIYPVEVYLQVNERGVRGLAAGVYYYDLRAHTLSLLAGEPLLRPDHHHTEDNRRVHEQAAVGVFLVADLDAITPLYGELAERFCLIEAGAMSQLLEMRAFRHGLATRPIGMLDFASAAAGLGLRPNQKLVYSLLGGRPAAAGNAVTPADSAATAVTSAPAGPESAADAADQLDRPHQALPATALHAEVDAHTDLRLSRCRAARRARKRPTQGSQAILVTGATGFLGAYAVSELLRRTDATVYGLVRAPDSDTAGQRLHRALHRYGRQAAPEVAHRLVGVPGDLSQDRFGLSAAEYEQLAATVDTVLHSGAKVSWNRSYRQLVAANVAGTSRIVDFVAARPGRRLMHVSTVAVFPFGGSQPVSEDAPLEHDGLLYGGYPQSKWVAEQVVRRAGEQGLDVTVLRPGTITGDSETGAFNPSSFLDLFLISCIQLGWAPTVDCPLDVTPVDYAAAAAVALTTRPDAGRGAYHLTHPAPLPLAEVYDLIEAYGYPLRREPFDAWRSRLLAPDAVGASGLAPFAAYLAGCREEFLRMPPYDSSRTVSALPADLSCPPVTGQLISTYLQAYIRSGYLRAPGRR